MADVDMNGMEDVQPSQSPLPSPLHLLPSHLTSLLLQFHRLQHLPVDNPLLLARVEVLTQLIDTQSEIQNYLLACNKCYTSQHTPSSSPTSITLPSAQYAPPYTSSSPPSLSLADYQALHGALSQFFEQVSRKRHDVEQSMKTTVPIGTRPYWVEENDRGDKKENGVHQTVASSSSSSSSSSSAPNNPQATPPSSQSQPQSSSQQPPPTSTSTSTPTINTSTSSPPQSTSSVSPSASAAASPIYILPPDRRRAPGNRYQKIRTLRTTLFGKVCLYFDSDTQQRVAIKFSNKSLLISGRTAQGNPVAENPMKELEYLRILSHRTQQVDANGKVTMVTQYIHPGQYHVLQLLDECEDDSDLWTVLEFCGKGEFFDIVCAEQRFEEQKARHYFIELAQGVAYLHAHLICHLDLSLENLLMDDANRLKICDLGVARMMTLDQHHHLTPYPGIRNNKPGKLGYMSPELFAGSSFYGHLSDIWAMGIILFISITGVPPYQLPSLSDQRFKLIYEGKIDDLLKAWRMESLMSFELKDLLRHILCPPERRMNIQQVLNHPWVLGKKIEHH